MPWLMKAEPDSRVVKGKDVKFSVDDFEKIGISPWDGVRSHEAKSIMKSKMKLGDKVLFYHSNTKIPGVFAIAEVAKEGYPDYTAWDASHPYHDPKSSEDDPTWYMVSVKFLSRVAHPPTLALIKHLSTLTALPSEIDYIGEAGLAAIASMQLVNRGRLSVQPVTEEAFQAVVLLGERGGWDELVPAKVKPKAKAKAKGKASEMEDADAEAKPEVEAPGEVWEGEPRKAKSQTKARAKGKVVKADPKEDDGDDGVVEKKEDEMVVQDPPRKGRKRKSNAVKSELDPPAKGERRSQRIKR